MAVDNFTPEIWSARILSNLHKTSVFAQLCNRDYEGEIARAGDTVHVNSIGPISELTYTKNTDLTLPETLTDAQRTIVIDKSPAFNFQYDDVDAIQNNVNLLEEAAQEAAYMFRDSQDLVIAGLHGDADAANLVGTTASPTSLTTASDVYPALLQLREKLLTANNRLEGTAVVIPYWVETKLLTDDRFVKTGAAATHTRLLNGEIGNVAGLRVITSNNVATVTGSKYKIMAFNSSAITLAEQRKAHVEAYRLERRFADGVKGHMLYGTKVIRPKSLAVLTATA